MSLFAAEICIMWHCFLFPPKMLMAQLYSQFDILLEVLFVVIELWFLDMPTNSYSICFLAKLAVLQSK